MKMFIAGEWVDRDEKMDVQNPFDGSIIDTVPRASVEDVALLRACVGPDWGVKASGGIRDAVQAWAMIAAGATRLGTSASVAMVESSRV